MKSLLIIIFLPLTISSFGQSEKEYLFVGHCYQYGSWGKKVDYRIESLDLDKYTGIWLGGDVCSEAMLYYSTIEYIDSLFKLSNPETHWALGNHDARVGNWEWYETFTNRKTYYAYSNNEITRIILNTNIVPTQCELLNEQYSIISDVCDTISESKYLILLMHHGIWNGVPNLAKPSTYAHSDLDYWNANCDSVETSFADVIYPKLVEVQNRGIQVICVLGDMGTYTKTYFEKSVDSIIFLGCGLYNNEPEDEVLIFTYDTESQILNFKFHNLDSLVNISINNKF